MLLGSDEIDFFSDWSFRVNAPDDTVRKHSRRVSLGESSRCASIAQGLGLEKHRHTLAAVAFMTVLVDVPTIPAAYGEWMAAELDRFARALRRRAERAQEIRDTALQAAAPPRTNRTYRQIMEDVEGS